MELCGFAILKVVGSVPSRGGMICRRNGEWAMRWFQGCSTFFGKTCGCHGEAAGLTLASRDADPEFGRGTYERPIQQAIAANLAPGDAFFDIGAISASSPSSLRAGRNGRPSLRLRAGAEECSRDPSKRQLNGLTPFGCSPRRLGRRAAAQSFFWRATSGEPHSPRPRHHPI